MAKVAHHAPTLEWDTPLYQQASTQLEHALEPRLANRADMRVAQMFAGDQAARRIAFESSRGQASEALHSPIFDGRRHAHVGASSAWPSASRVPSQPLGQDALVDHGT